jgi:hypothetical protein
MSNVSVNMCEGGVCVSVRARGGACAGLTYVVKQGKQGGDNTVRRDGLCREKCSRMDRDICERERVHNAGITV